MDIEALKLAIEASGEEWEVQAYSGRGMYRKQCAGVIVDDDSDMFRLGVILGQAGLDPAPPSSDSMGRSVIVYWRGLEWPDDDDEDENDE